MTRQTVILVGNLPFEMPALNRLVQEMGWALEVAEDFAELRDRQVSRKPAAILIAAQSTGLSWQETLEEARKIDSDALLIACHRFSDPVSWPELAEAGAFHSLALPLDPNEVRQSLAFVWSAWFRRTSKVVTLRRTEARTERDQDLPYSSVGASTPESARRLIASA